MTYATLLYEKDDRIARMAENARIGYMPARV